MNIISLSGVDGFFSVPRKTVQFHVFEECHVRIASSTQWIQQKNVKQINYLSIKEEDPNNTNTHGSTKRSACFKRM
jgi:hypothetical protein